MKDQPFDYINRTYHLNAFVGMRVTYTGGSFPRKGTIKGANGQYLSIHLDDEKKPLNFHPTWELTLHDVSQDSNTQPASQTPAS